MTVCREVRALDCAFLCHPRQRTVRLHLSAVPHLASFAGLQSGLEEVTQTKTGHTRRLAIEAELGPLLAVMHEGEWRGADPLTHRARPPPCWIPSGVLPRFRILMEPQ